MEIAQTITCSGFFCVHKQFLTTQPKRGDAPPPKKAGRPSKKSNETGIETVKFEKNNTCPQETRHTVVLFCLI